MTRQQQLQNQLQAQESKESVENLYQKYPYFKTGNNIEDVHNGKLATENIRIALKRAFPDTKFFINKTGYSCINISWTNGVNQSSVETLLSSFKLGIFILDDFHHYIQMSRFNFAFGGVKCITYSHSHSD